MGPQMFSLVIPEINGGTDIWVSARWSQKLVYKGCEFSITIPFTFPDYVNPWVRHLAKKQKIQLNVNTGTGKELLLQRTSHPLKEKERCPGKLSLLYESNVEKWSTTDFHFSCVVESSDLFGGVIIQPPTMNDDDPRDMFCLYLFPGNNQNTKVFRKQVVFVIDISGSMQGKPLEYVKNALSSAISELNPEDSFDIIAFNDGVHCFSSQLQSVTDDTIQNANRWISENLIGGGGTEIMHPLNEAMGLLSSAENSVPHIFLITDGTVQDERNICNSISTNLANRGSIAPRISTFGIGSYCNHYFLKTLASLGRGQYDVSYDIDSIDTRMQGWFHKALSSIVTNIKVDIFENSDKFEVYPLPIPDLSAGCPLFVMGRCEGNVPDFVKVKGILADASDLFIDLPVENIKEYSIEKASAQHEIHLLTTRAWFSESKVLEEKVKKLSIISSIQSEYTVMIQVLTETQLGVKQSKNDYVKMHASPKDKNRNLLRGLTVGFGDITATNANLPANFVWKKLPDAFDAYCMKAAGCCGNFADNCCCCSATIKVCSGVNDQFAILLTQIFTILSCYACFECCTICCNDSDN